MSEEKVLTKDKAIEWIDSLEELNNIEELSSPDLSAYEKVDEDALLEILNFEIPEELQEGNREGHYQLSLIERWIDPDPLGVTLFLDGLSEVTPSLAEILTRFGMNLSLNGLTEISDESLDELKENEGSLFMNGISVISDSGAAKLAQTLGNTLKLNGISELSDLAAESLSRFHGDLHLNGVKFLSGSASLSLSRHFGSRLYQSTEWEDHLGSEGYPIVTQSKLLSVGTLSLNGVASVSDEVAENLSNYSGNLSLEGLSELSDASVRSLAKIDQDNLWVSQNIQKQISAYR